MRNFVLLSFPKTVPGLLGLFCLVFFQTAYAQKSPAAMSQIKMGPPEDFETFYNNFFVDSAFQASRIYFPLQGSYKRGELEYRWKEDEWLPLRTPKDKLDASRFKSKRKQKKYTVDEKAWSKETGMIWDRRFALLGNRWFLVFAYERLE